MKVMLMSLQRVSTFWLGTTDLLPVPYLLISPTEESKGLSRLPTHNRNDVTLPKHQYFLEAPTITDLKTTPE